MHSDLHDCAQGICRLEAPDGKCFCHLRESMQLVLENKRRIHFFAKGATEHTFTRLHLKTKCKEVEIFSCRAIFRATDLRKTKTAL